VPCLCFFSTLALGMQDDTEINVFRCGGVAIYQVLCGHHLAKDHRMAIQMRNYCYLIVNTVDKTAVAVDAAWDVAGILGLAEQLGVKMRGSIYTHFHFDHCGGVDKDFTRGKRIDGAKEVQDTGGEIWAGINDVDLIKKQCGLASDIVGLNDGDAIDCGDLALHILNTPGHTPGSICIFAAPRGLSPRGDLGPTFKERVTEAGSGLLITGDTLFVGSSGATHFPGGSQEEMLRSLSRLSQLDPDVVVCPGHAYSDPFTTIGRERQENRVMMVGSQRISRPPALPTCVACGTSGTTCGPKGFIVGRKVRIRGLTSEAGQGLNGREGVISGFADDRERYAVKLFASGELRSLKPDNVEQPGIPTAELHGMD